MIFGPLPLQKKLFWGGVQKILVKNPKKWKLLKIAWNDEKIGQNKFLSFYPPLKKK